MSGDNKSKGPPPSPPPTVAKLTAIFSQLLGRVDAMERCLELLADIPAHLAALEAAHASSPKATPCYGLAVTTAAITDAQQIQDAGEKLLQIARLVAISLEPAKKGPASQVLAAVLLQAAACGLLV